MKEARRGKLVYRRMFLQECALSCAPLNAWQKWAREKTHANGISLQLSSLMTALRLTRNLAGVTTAISTNSLSSRILSNHSSSMWTSEGLRSFWALNIYKHSSVVFITPSFSEMNHSHMLMSFIHNTKLIYAHLLIRCSSHRTAAAQVLWKGFLVLINLLSGAL